MPPDTLAIRERSPNTRPRRSDHLRRLRLDRERSLSPWPKRDTSRTISAWPLRHRQLPVDAGCVPGLPSRPPADAPTSPVRAETSERVRTRPGRIRFLQTSFLNTIAPFETKPTTPATHASPGAPGIVGWLSKKTIACHGSVQHVVHKAAAGEPSASRHDDEPNRTTHRPPIKHSRP